MVNWNIFLPIFFAATVEWVEAFTIVLAVSLSIGWRAAGSASLAALAVLAAMTIFADGFLRYGATDVWVQGAVGVLLLLFGLRWLAKAIARQAGLKALHDESQEFAETRAKLAHSDRQASWMIAFTGVMVEGLEVWLIVVALGMRETSHWTAYGAALSALLVVMIMGFVVRAPLSRVPENLIKFAVGAAITAFGTFWTLVAIAGEAVWPWGDWSLLILAVVYFVAGQIIARTLLRQQKVA
ncbi:MAG TPA: hypothetical protein VL574_15440 [Stellaceae bacterium]|nr:hypothetical protein [Stellaceae bacterium]